MTQVLNSIESPKAKALETDDNRGSGRITETANILYGNRLNRCTPAHLAPDEKVSKGYRDGLAGVQSSALHSDPHYRKGWDLGYAERQRTQLAAEGLTIIYGHEDLSRVLPGLDLWQSRKQKGEVVEIRYFTDERRYALCASVELVDRELPF